MTPQGPGQTPEPPLDVATTPDDLPQAPIATVGQRVRVGTLIYRYTGQGDMRGWEIEPYVVRGRALREPTAQAREFARVVRDHTDALVREGFTEEAALRFLGTWFGTANRPPENPQ